MKRRVWLNGIVVVGLLLALVGATGASRALSHPAPVPALDDDVQDCNRGRWRFMKGPSGTDSQRYGVWGSSGRDVFAVGVDGTILHYSHYNTPYREAPNVEQQFHDLQSFGDPLAARVGAGLTDYGSPGACRHYQGMARGADSEGTPYLFLTRNRNKVWTCGGQCYPGELLIVRMGSRDKNGERLRNNRLKPDKEFGATAPPLGDRGVVSRLFDGIGRWPKYWHAGGVQLIDDHLAVPLECTANGCPNEDCIATAGLLLIDVGDPENPVVRYHRAFDTEFQDGLGAVGVTRSSIYEDKYLFVFTWGNSSEWAFAYSNGYPLGHYDFDIDIDTLVRSSPEIPTNISWQTLNLVRDTSGGLYLIAADNSTDFPGVGNDYIALYSVDESRLLPSLSDKAVTFLQVRHIQVDDADIGSRNLGDLDAASGIYVSPTGQLILYTADHRAFTAEDALVIDMGEFRSIYLSTEAPPNATCGPQWRENHLGGPYEIPEGSSLELNGEVYVIEPWVHMFDGINLNADDPLAALMMDSLDQGDDDFDNFSTLTKKGWTEWFNDDMSSFTFCGPEVSYLRIYEHRDFEGNHIVCEGTENVIRWLDVRKDSDPPHGCSYGKGRPGDNWASSAKIIYEPPVQRYLWSPSPECADCLTETGGGESAVFRAPPGIYDVTLHYQPYPGTETAEIEVVNVPPTVSLTGPDSADEGDIKTYSFTVTDPGQDTLTFPDAYPNCGNNSTLVGTPSIGEAGLCCDPGEQPEAGICYPQCKPEYEGEGSSCCTTCKPGYEEVEIGGLLWCSKSLFDRYLKCYDRGFGETAYTCYTGGEF